MLLHEKLPEEFQQSDHLAQETAMLG